MSTTRYQIMVEPGGVFAVTTVEDEAVRRAKDINSSTTLALEKLDAALAETKRWQQRVKDLEARLVQITRIAEGRE